MDEGFLPDADALGVDASADHTQKETTQNEVRPRVIQYEGKRYGIRLEDCFWAVLEREAKSRGWRLNRLVHEMYTSPEAGRNRTAFLREHAMEWVSEELDKTRQELELNHSEIANILKMTRRPALLVNSELSVARFNRPFREWFGARSKSEISYVRISFRASRRVLDDRMLNSGGISVAEPAAIIFPGRAIPIELDLTSLSGSSDKYSILAVFHKDYR